HQSFGGHQHKGNPGIRPDGAEQQQVIKILGDVVWRGEVKQAAQKSGGFIVCFAFYPEVKTYTGDHGGKQCRCGNGIKTERVERRKEGKKGSKEIGKGRVEEKLRTAAACEHVHKPTGIKIAVPELFGEKPRYKALAVQILATRAEQECGQEAYAGGAENK